MSGIVDKKLNLEQPRHTESFFRYAMVVEYIGSSYAGSQKQENAHTVQAELESALAVIAKNDIKTVFSGRTDAGVHAKGQIVHFSMPHKIDILRYTLALNAILPADISIKKIMEVTPDFHSQKSALFRWYRYIINNNRYRSVWNNHALHVPQKLDVKEMNKALSYLKGKHDFTSFKNSNTNNPAKECLMYNSECTSEAGIISIDLVADRFLYNMVRIIVGTVIEIGKGIYKAEHINHVLEIKDRNVAGPTVKPDGLTLMMVGYSKKYDIYDELNKEAIIYENLLCKAS